MFHPPRLIIISHSFEDTPCIVLLTKRFTALPSQWWLSWSKRDGVSHALTIWRVVSHAWMQILESKLYWKEIKNERGRELHVKLREEREMRCRKKLLYAACKDKQTWLTLVGTLLTHEGSTVVSRELNRWNVTSIQFPTRPRCRRLKIWALVPAANFPSMHTSTWNRAQNRRLR